MIDVKLIGKQCEVKAYPSFWNHDYAENLETGNYGSSEHRWHVGDKVALFTCPSGRHCTGEYELRTLDGKYSTGGFSESSIECIIGPEVLSEAKKSLEKEGLKMSNSFVGKRMRIRALPDGFDHEQYYDIDDDEWYFCAEDFEWQIGIPVYIRHFEDDSTNSTYEIMDEDGNFTSDELTEQQIREMFQLSESEYPSARVRSDGSIVSSSGLVLKKQTAGGRVPLRKVEEDRGCCAPPAPSKPILRKIEESYGSYNPYGYPVSAAASSKPILRKIEEKAGDSIMTSRAANGFIKQFGAVTDGSVALTIGGQIAVRNGEEYFRWNAEANAVESQLDLVIKDASEYIYIFPVVEVAVGDIIKHKNSYLQILEVGTDGSLSTVNIQSGTHCKVAKETSIIGISFFYKVVCLFQQITAAGTMNPAMLLLLKDDGFGGGKDSLLPLLMMGGLGGGTTGAIDPMMMMLLMDKSGGFELKDMLLMQSLGKGAGGAIDPMMMMALLGDGKMDAKTLMLMGMMNAKK